MFDKLFIQKLTFHVLNPLLLLSSQYQILLILMHMFPRLNLNIMYKSVIKYEMFHSPRHEYWEVEEREILYPCHLDDLPETRCIENCLFGDVYSKGEFKRISCDFSSCPSGVYVVQSCCHCRKIKNKCK